MTNNIQALLNNKGISIKQMSKDLELTYARAHSLATRDSLETIALGRVAKIADYLNVNIEMLYKEELSMMYKLIMKEEGQTELLTNGTIKEIVEWIQKNEDIYNWVYDEDNDMEAVDLSQVESFRDLEYELDKVDLSWWALEVEEV